ncbi:Uncharacterized protein Fot_54578 [Forsythia ovata]|uniref:Uncharacterized protein n=1 Tax=Forsythia ovata TaxID=205694 RepID=A0ABD1P9Q7_9LAMI
MQSREVLTPSFSSYSNNKFTEVAAQVRIFHIQKFCKIDEWVEINLALSIETPLAPSSIDSINYKNGIVDRDKQVCNDFASQTFFNFNNSSRPSLVDEEDEVSLACDLVTPSVAILTRKVPKGKVVVLEDGKKKNKSQKVLGVKKMMATALQMVKTRGPKRKVGE